MKSTKSSIWNEVRVFVLICLFRFLNTFLVKSYFDPDEFWQTMEPAYCHVFNPQAGYDCPGFTWEWKRRPPNPLPEQTHILEQFVPEFLWGPARTYLSVVPTYLFFQALRWMQADTTWWVSRGPMILYAITTAAPTDYAVWYIAKFLPQRPTESSSSSSTQQSTFSTQCWCLFSSLVSWFGAFSMVRTFANAQETLLIIWSIALVAPEFVGQVDPPQPRYRLRSSLSFLLGGMAASIRFTALAAYIPMGIILAWQERSNKSSILSKILFLLSPCALFGLTGIGCAMVVDSLFFGFWAVPFLGNFHFNVILNYADLYGAHPWHWNFTSALPVVAGLLLPFAILDMKRISQKGQGGMTNLWILVIFYLGIMSFNAHKEFRYILPILPLVCLLASQRLQAFMGFGKKRISFVRAAILAAFVLANLTALLYLGLFHQSGSISANHWILEHALAKHQLTGKTDFPIHYLTGECHSTPLHSHLHAPPLVFHTRTLDCSPTCRADPDQECETTRFRSDPGSFLAQTLSGECQADTETCSISDTAATDDMDYVVTMSSYVSELSTTLSPWGIRPIVRFPFHINGLKLGEQGVGEGVANDAFTKIQLFSGLEISLDEIVVLAKD